MSLYRFYGALGEGYNPLVRSEPLDRRRVRAMQELGLDPQTPSGGSFGGAAMPQPPPTWPPLAGVASNNRGNSITITPGTVVPTIVSTPQASGPDAKVICVTLGMAFTEGDPEETVTGTDPLDIKAMLEWGIGNATFTAQADWIKGTTLAIAASFLRVGARFEDAGLAGGLPVKLDAGLAYGYTGRRVAPARFTQKIFDSDGNFTIDPGDTCGPFEIPNFAVSYCVLSSTATANIGVPVTPIAITQVPTVPAAGVPVSGCQTTLYSVGTNAGLQNEAQIPIISGNRYIYVQNQGAAVAHIQVVFALAL